MMLWLKQMAFWLSLFLSAQSASGQAEQPLPRAWLVTRGDTAAVVVGESHIYTPLEFDSYYEDVVKPSFLAAKVALLESYFGDENLVNLGFNRDFPCEHEPTQPRPRVEERFSKLILATRRSKLEVPVWMTEWYAFPEISLVSAHLSDYEARRIFPAIQAAETEHIDTSGVSFRLAASARGGGSFPKLFGLDTVASVRNHFCAATNEHRQDHLVNAVNQMIGRLRMLEEVRRTGIQVDFAPEASRLLRKVLACVDLAVPCSFTATVESATLARFGAALSDSPGFFKLAIQDRTNAWVPKIANAMAEKQRVFVAVGSAHLPDFRFNDKTYPGLLNLLRSQGYEVKAIRDAKDLNEVYLRKSWWKTLFAL